MSASLSIRFRLAGAAALMLLAPAAWATPVSLTYLGPSATNPQAVTIEAAPVAWPGAGSWPKRVGAFGFNMRDGLGVLDDFVAWCLDLGSFLGTSGAHAYTITQTPYTNSYGLDDLQRARVQSVFDANYGGLTLSDGIQVAGFQLALWEALYDSDGNLGTGTFRASASGSILTAAAGFLGAASGWAGGRRYEMTFLQSTATGHHKRQNLVTVSPVPLPAGGLLLLTALGGLAWARRRRGAARVA
jgi:hypothetical protein